MNQLYPLTLFIIKKFHGYDGGHSISNGLKTSAQFAVDLLLYEGYRAQLVEAVDSNSIDGLVVRHAPARVVLEAIWVTPAKMAELRRLHPKVKWTVRVHSETPFLAQEGVATQWITEYLKQGIEVAFNSTYTTHDYAMFGKTTYLPNWYPLRCPRKHVPNGRLDIGCFGAIRPLKNQLIQAMAAIQYAKKIGMGLTFHMNGARVEQNGNNNLKNIKAVFAAVGPLYRLQMHDWLPHEDFLELVAMMDICLQVSLTESFNITSADAVSMGVPLVGSAAIRWLPEHSVAATDSTADIVRVMLQADRTMVLMNHAALHKYLHASAEVWRTWVKQ